MVLSKNEMYYDKYLKYKIKYNILRGGGVVGNTILDIFLKGSGRLLAISGYVFDEYIKKLPTVTGRVDDYQYHLLKIDEFKKKGDKAVYVYNNIEKRFSLIFNNKAEQDKIIANKKHLNDQLNTLMMKFINNISLKKHVKKEDKSEIDPEDENQNNTHITNILHSLENYKATAKILKCEGQKAEEEKILTNLKNELDQVLTKNITALALIGKNNNNCIDIKIDMKENPITDLSNIFNNDNLIRELTKAFLSINELYKINNVKSNDPSQIFYLCLMIPYKSKETHEENYIIVDFDQLPKVYEKLASDLGGKNSIVEQIKRLSPASK